MKKIFLILLILLSYNFARESLESPNICNYGLLTNIKFEARSENDTVSNYQFDEYRERDRLYITNMLVWNTGNCSLSNIKIELFLIKPNGDEVVFCPDPNNDSGGYIVPSLSSDNYLNIAPTSGYQKRYNVISCGKLLDQVGTYYIKYKLSWANNFTNRDYVPYGIRNETFAINGTVFGNPSFVVKSRNELENIRIQRDSLDQLKSQNT